MKVLLASLLCMSALASSLTVKVVGFKNYNGSAQVALWDTPSGFPDDYNTAYLTKTTKATKNYSVTFENLKPGSYAVAMYHDKNNNLQMDTNFFGIPKEGFGFSNNPTIFTGPPSFTKVKFIVKENQNKSITIKLKHF